MVMNTVMSSSTRNPVNIPGNQKHLLQPSLTRLMDAVLSKDLRKAEDLVSSLMNNGNDGQGLFRDIFQPLFQQLASYMTTGQISQARAAAASELAFQVMRGVVDRYSPKGLYASPSKLLIGCIQGDQHDIGCRIVANLFEMTGWNVVYVDSDADKESFIQTVLETEPDLIGISVSNLLQVPTLKELIIALHNCEIADRFKIMVGGYPFSINPSFALEVGADFTARNATEAVSKARRYVTRYAEYGASEVTTFVV